MATWTTEELDRIGQAEELQLATRRRDGGLSRHVTMWVVRADDSLYVRSAYGPGNPWYRRARAAGEGRVRAGGVERDVTFESAGSAVQGASTPPTTPNTTGTAPRSSAPLQDRRRTPSPSDWPKPISTT